MDAPISSTPTQSTSPFFKHSVRSPGSGLENTEEKTHGSQQQLSAEEAKIVEDLKRRDTEVRAHELAHLNAAGRYATSGANFTLVTGPDGKRYAVSGDVQVDVSEVADDPAATMEKAEQIKRAALAPAAPSMQDRRVAADASAMASKAQMELIQMTQELQQNSEHSEQALGAIMDVSV